MTADTTQPAGALPEPVHFRALLADDERPQQLNSAMHVCGFRDRRTAENWVASKLDFDHWRYTLEPLYAESDMRAMMAERDAAREQSEIYRKDAHTAMAEYAALRRELEELRGQKPVAEVTNAGLLRATASGVALRPMDKLYARPIPPDAREGREPQCEWTLDSDPDISIWNSSCGEAWTFTDDGPIENSVRFCHGCGKAVKLAGTSAEGEHHGS